MGTRLGTPHAMAPEQIRGEPVDERADIYALGVLMFHGLTGGYPFKGTTAPELERLHLTAPPPAPSRAAPVTAALDAVVLRCLEKKPEGRYQSVAEVLAALRVAVAGAPAPAAQEESVALHVELADRADASEDEQAELMDEAEQALRGAGYQLPVQTGNLLLAVRPVSGDARADRRQALELGRELARRGLKVALHVGGGDGLLRVTDWELESERDGVRLTRAGAADLD
jgi:serine/threonine-protein kinase